ncbi:MAG: hypothetical protein IPK27_16130 [Rhodanobacteraceae bacterium]|nr:hypothetical protein [Rhodanobacteraceae bacterium]
MLVASAGSPLRAQTVNWPGSAPCDADFTTCLASVPTGGTLRIVSDQVIADRVILNRAVSIEAAPGVSAVFTASENHAFNLPGTAPWAVSLRNLRFEGSTLAVGIAGNQPGDLRLEGLSFRGNAANAQAQLYLQVNAATSARSRLVVRGCEFEIGSDNNAQFSIAQFGGGTVGMEMQVEDNRFRPEPVAIAQSFHRAWFANVGGSGNWDIVFRRNRILPANALPSRRFASGIEINTLGTVGVNLLVHDNMFALDQIAGAGGTAVSAGGSSGQVQVRVINNTITDASYATNFRANVFGRFDNNLVANGFRLHDGTALAANFTRRGNLEFGYALSNWATAPGTLTVDPQLGPNGQPLAGSPAINAGSDAARAETGPGIFGVPAALDAQGLRRTEGAHIDIGAYEGERIHYDGAE